MNVYMNYFRQLFIKIKFFHQEWNNGTSMKRNYVTYELVVRMHYQLKFLSIFLIKFTKLKIILVNRDQSPGKLIFALNIDKESSIF